MKQVGILIVSIILLITSGICEIKYLNNTSLYIKSDLDYIENAIRNNNYEYARAQYENTFSSWDKLKDVWHIFITSDEIDTINASMAELKYHLEFEDEKDALMTIEENKSSINHIIFRQNLKIDNVL